MAADEAITRISVKLPSLVYERLKLLVFKQRTTVQALAAGILERWLQTEELPAPKGYVDVRAVLPDPLHAQLLSFGQSQSPQLSVQQVIERAITSFVKQDTRETSSHTAPNEAAPHESIKGLPEVTGLSEDAHNALSLVTAHGDAETIRLLRTTIEIALHFAADGIKARLNNLKGGLSDQGGTAENPESDDTSNSSDVEPHGKPRSVSR